jgi:PAS domain S-box-containing protein
MSGNEDNDKEKNFTIASINGGKGEDVLDSVGFDSFFDAEYFKHDLDFMDLLRDTENSPTIHTSNNNDIGDNSSRVVKEASLGEHISSDGVMHVAPSVSVNYSNSEEAIDSSNAYLPASSTTRSGRGTRSNTKYKQHNATDFDKFTSYTKHAASNDVTSADILTKTSGSKRNASAMATASMSMAAELGRSNDSMDNSDPTRHTISSSSVHGGNVSSSLMSLSETQKVERRERNREHAKRSRVRKMVMLDLLTEQLNALRDENKKLRNLITKEIPDHASEILNQCTVEESLLLVDDDDDTPAAANGVNGVEETSVPDNAVSSSETCAEGTTLTERKAFRFKKTLAFQQQHGMAGSALAAAASAAAAGGDPVSMQRRAIDEHAKLLMEPDFRLISALVGAQQNFCLTDPALPDNPIVYCSDNFCKITGYKRSDVIGRNCRFLQGPRTDLRAVGIISKCLAEGTDVSVCLLNYKADGTPFWNQLFVAALKDSDGTVLNYVGVQQEVDNPPVQVIKDRVKRIQVDTTTH